MDYNSVFISGTITNKPFLGETKTGKPAFGFVLISERTFKDDETNTRRIVKTPIHCCIYGKRAATAAKTLTKGSHVLLQGELVENTRQSNGKTETLTKVSFSTWSLLPDQKPASPEKA